MNYKIITFFYIYRLNFEFQRLKVLIPHNFYILYNYDKVFSEKNI